MAGRLDSMLTRLDQLLDWFIPEPIAAQREAKQRARMFLLSHIFGPFLGNVIPLYLFVFSPAPDYRVGVLFLTITAFWSGPFILRAGANYTLLSFVSVQNLIFTILWGCYFYGGVSSPFLPWLLTVPLLAFFYLGPDKGVRNGLLVLIAANLAAFYGLYLFGHSFPETMPVSELQIIGIISTVSAAGYVTMMALYYAQILRSQVDLEHEVREHLITAEHLRETTTEAARAGAAKAEFVAKMSHELRTPLNAVIGYSQMLLEEAQDNDDETDVRDLMRIQSAGQHLLRMVNNVLDYSKIDAGKMELDPEHIDMAELVADLIDARRAEADKRGNIITLTAEPGLGTAFIDEMNARKAILPVLENAVKFTENGQIDIYIRRVAHERSDMFEVSIADTGVGIPASMLSTLFDAFSGVGDDSASKYGGAGLGLALSKKICALLGGEISVTSALSRGSCFTLLLPVTQPSADQAEEVAETSADDAVGHAAAA